MQFAEKISLLMRARGFTTRSLGAAVNVSNGTVAGWMKGSLPRPEAAARIASFFEIGVEDLLDDSRELPATVQLNSGGVRFAVPQGRRSIQQAGDDPDTEALHPNQLPEWWDRLPQPEDHAELKTRVPHVYARLKLAAEKSFLGDLAASHGRKRESDQECPLNDAFEDLNLKGTGFPSLPGFQAMANVYTNELYRLRSGTLEERVAEQAREITRQRSMLEEILRFVRGKGKSTSPEGRDTITPAVAAKLAEHRRLREAQEREEDDEDRSSSRAAGE